MEFSNHARRGEVRVAATTVRWLFLATAVIAVLLLVFLLASAALDGGGV